MDPTIATFRRLLNEWLDEQHASRVEHLAQGSAETIENYREAVGYLRALRDVKVECQEIVSKMRTAA